MDVEYFSICDGIELQPVKNWDDSDYIVGCITVYCGDVREIDNITYKKPKQVWCVAHFLHDVFHIIILFNILTPCLFKL